MFRKYFFILFLTASGFSLKSQVISAARSVNWSSAGVEPGTEWPVTKRNVLDYGAVADGVTPNNNAVKNAIASLSGQPGIIYFPAGNYFFNDAIALSSGIVLKGDDAASSILTFNLNGVIKSLVQVFGSLGGVFTPLTAAGLSKNSDSIVLATPFAFNEGDFIEIQQDGGIYLTSDWAAGALAQMNKIKSISGNTIKLTYPLRRSFDFALNPRVQKMNMIQNAGVECLKIIRQDATVYQTSHIAFTNAANCIARNCWFEQCNFSFIAVGKSLNLTIDGNYFYNAFSWEDGGQAYGVSLEFSSGQVLVENNIFRLLRHSVIMQSGANGNVAAYNYSRESLKTTFGFNTASEDFTCHGNYPYCNLFEGNIGGAMKVDDSHGINGRFNTFFRNRTTASGGLTVSESNSDSQNVVGNQITSSGAYSFDAAGHLLYGNNRNGTVSPAGTDDLMDSSYYLHGKPAFWNIADNWFGIGYPNTTTTSSIPALVRYNNFSNGTITNPAVDCMDGTLPLQIIFFKSAVQQNGDVKLQWQIANPEQLQNAELQRSKDGSSFEAIANFVSEGSNYFTYNDISDGNSNTGISVFYRLKFTDRNNKKTYSNILKVSFQKKISLIISPNPVSNTFRVIASGVELAGTTAEIISGEGKIVKRFIVSIPQKDVDVKQLAAGIYTIHFANAQNLRMVKQ